MGIKAPVFSMSKLTGVDWYMGPEMKSTGEVMGVDHDFPAALAKALTAGDITIKPGGAVLLSIADRDKAESAILIRELLQAEFTLYATEGTAAMIQAMGAPVTTITKKLSEGHPNVVDVINQGLVDGVVNTVSEADSSSEGRVLHTAGGGGEAHPVLHVFGHRQGRRGEPPARAGQLQHQAHR